MAHTPKPWEYAEAGGFNRGNFQLEEYFVRRPEDDVAIASEIIDPDTCLPSLDNARLIAAAPDLLDACKAALEYVANMERIPAFEMDVYQRCHAAIAKAEAQWQITTAR